MKTHAARLVLMLLAVAIFGSCARKTESQSKSDPKTGTAAIRRDSRGARSSPVTREECLEFAGRLEQAASAGDLAAFNREFDWRAMVDKSIAPLDAPAAIKKTVGANFLRGVEEPPRFSGDICQQVAAGGSFKLLRVRNRAHQLRPLFRLMPVDGGFTYIEIILARRERVVKAVDIYNFVNGERISETFRRFLRALLADETRGLVDRLTGNKDVLVEHFGSVERMSEALRDNRPLVVLEIYSRLPLSAQRETWIQLTRLRAAQRINDQEYERAIQDFRKFHPQSEALDLVTLDAYLMQKKYAEFLAAIDRLDRTVGGDPFLQMTRATIYLEQHDPARARAAALAAVDADSSLVNAYWTLVYASLQQKEYDETLRFLKLIRERFNQTITDLAAAPEFAEFVKTPQHQEWLEFERVSTDGLAAQADDVASPAETATAEVPEAQGAAPRTEPDPPDVLERPKVISEPDFPSDVDFAEQPQP